MQVADLINAMEMIAPLSYAEPWDRVGLHLGRPRTELDGPVLLTIDLTEAVLHEAIESGVRAIVAYHPPIWEPLKSVTNASAKERIILGAAEARIAIYSAHTALDSVPGGVTDWLCEGISGSEEPGKIHGDCRSMSPAADGEHEVKIVTFLPESSLETVRNALATAGAGRIGEYSLCTFSSRGTGTFLGSDASNPAIGQSGRLEQVEELRLETVCPKEALPLALETLRAFHPYEEPAIDVYELAPKPRRTAGAGRRLVLDQPATVAEIAERLKKHLGRARIRAAILGEDKPVSRIAVVPGAGESMAPLARRIGSELFFTGEMRHHQVNAALDGGMSVLLAGHTNTERGYLPRLAQALRDRLPGAEIRLSTEDRDLLTVM
ncbi:MAG: Nif3-like dinuclear metal center hexameric protein [Phycisphaerales bacterium]|nr:MAG: Nif3-like dinuclear metal center hexameric protein [Phycisphaerales bacterium]